MTILLFAAFVLSIIIISGFGWFLAGNAAARLTGRIGPLRARALYLAIGAVVIALAAGATWWYAARSKDAALVASPVPMSMPALPALPTMAQPLTEPKQGGDLAVMVDRLAARLNREPNDAQGWALYARTQMELARYPGAAAAYAQAVSMLPGDADLHTERADAEMMANSRQWNKTAADALAVALKLKPDHLEALWLAGSERFDSKDYRGAVKHWEKLARLASPDSDYARQMKSSLVEARALRDGIDPGAALAAAGALPDTTAKIKTPDSADRGSLAAELAATLAAMRAESGASTGSSAGLATALSAGTSTTVSRPVVRGEVRIDRTLQGRIEADDTVFIFAHAARAGSGTAPLAAIRRRASELPIRFELSDNDAMSNGPKMSTAKALVITARVSRTGNPRVNPGDLEGASNVISPGAEGVAITISRSH